MNPINMNNPVLILFGLDLNLVLTGFKDSAEILLSERPGAQAGYLVLEPCINEARDVVYEADYRTLVVRENRADPSSRLIALPILCVRSTGKNSGNPIFNLGGGPGWNMMSFPGYPGLFEDHAG